MTTAASDTMAATLPEGAGPQLEQAHWGYTIRAADEAGRAGVLASIGGRFFGMILIMVAVGLWVMPNGQLGPEVFAMKIAASVMFAIFGAWFAWAGSKGPQEIQVDTTREELRVGTRDRKGAFHLSGTLHFSDVGSVFMLRSKNQSQTTRLFLRIGNGDEALEIAVGAEARLEAIRTRLAQDLTRQARPERPLEARLARHAVLAA